MCVNVDIDIEFGVEELQKPLTILLTVRTLFMKVEALDVLVNISRCSKHLELNMSEPWNH